MVVVLVFEETVLRLICGYVLKSVRSLEVKQFFYYGFKNERDIHSVADMIVSLGDFIGHVLVGIFSDLLVFIGSMVLGVEFGRKNVTTVMPG